MNQSPRELAQEIADACAPLDQVRLMEVCGTHTVSLFRSGVKSMLPANLKLISGPGCPVCVTSQGYIDAACSMAERDDVTVCTYGDMVRVPGQFGSLEDKRADGAKIMVVYSARDAVQFAADHPQQQVVFLAVGFETTAPATAAAVLEAEQRNLDNFTVLAGHKLVIPAMSTLLSAGDVPIDGFICPGHVSVIIGANAYKPIVEVYKKPCVVAGFEADQMLKGILHLARQIAAGEVKLENVYPAAVSEDGNAIARQMLEKVLEPAPVVWRAMGTLPESGLELRPAYERFDARRRFHLEMGEDYDLPGCRCGEVIQGKVEPNECKLFGTTCTPRRPVGPCMVSSEGTCAAWYKYGEPHQRKPIAVAN